MDNLDRDTKEDYIISQVQLTDLDERIHVLRLIMDNIDEKKIILVPDSTLVKFEDISDELIDRLYKYLLDRQKENAIDFSYIKTEK
jgi:hypothetical protein